MNLAAAFTFLGLVFIAAGLIQKNRDKEKEAMVLAVLAAACLVVVFVVQFVS